MQKTSAVVQRREGFPMKIHPVMNWCCAPVAFLVLALLPYTGLAAEKLVGIHSARTMSQSMPWIAEEVGLFRKYDLNF
jgi:hypothetical protein